MDYSLEMKRFIVEAKQDYTYDLLSVMESESEFMLSCLESMSIIDGMDTLLEAKGGPGIWEKIKEFFKNLMGVFTSKVKSFSDRDLKWLNANVNKLKNTNVDGISMELLSYWKVDFNTIKNTTQSTINRLFADIKSVKKILINASAKNDKLSELVKFDAFTKYDNGDGSTEGYKNYLRTGNNKGSKPVTIEGAELKRLIPGFIDYCLSYERDVVPFIKTQMNFIDRETKTIESRIKSVKEHTLLVEDCILTESELRYCQGFEILTEADENISVTTVKVNKSTEENNDETKKDNNSKDTNSTDDKKEDYYSNTSKAELKYLNEGLSNIKLVLTSTMTVLEEKYVTYMKVLRAVMSSGKEEEGENIVKNAKK